VTSDPLGYYARLGVAPDSAPAELKAAFRRQARRLHPDVPDTGDAAAFVRLKQAYDTLADPTRRAAYHRSTTQSFTPPRPRDPSPRGRRGLLLAAISAGVVGAIVVVVAVFHTPPPPPAAPIPVSSVPVRAPAPLTLAGEPDHYVLPGSLPVVVWGLGPGGVLTQLGALADFAPVHASATNAPDGLTGVALAGGLIGYVDAGRLMEGDAAAARRARCAWFAGPPPAGAEVLVGGPHGDGRASLNNASGSPAVITLRDPAGRQAARIYLAPGKATHVAGLAPGPWTAEVTFGELWSRACASFVAGERMQRASEPLPPGGTLTIGLHAPDN